ncbi:hypothetical protein PJF56_19340 [Roseofilum sp. BLCC_M91]|uniref:Type II secretion system protein GspE N-terminal domain-containing protein n=1 Tax=Roseofilum halophilum BLCC-M91 TaxID=3022259 RepID=A0ABT7BP97_9CYAN|nr:hypothetical protein [Roseofilum halophilum]MDJ1181019.1 hypothetical protein [Roseofilum halophilum BLCC-M91]
MSLPSPSFHSSSISHLDIDSDRIFPLIDRALSFEACLYHQVLPLALEGSRLRLGMVDPEDNSALTYCRQILSYLRCSIVTQKISSDLHQSSLKAYLNHVSSQQQAPPALPNPSPPPPSRSQGNAESDHWQNRPTLVLDADEVINLVKQDTSESDSTAKPPPSVTPLKRTQGLPELNIQAQYLSSPVASLATLPPSILWQELLSRVLVGGIGRLFFERHPHHGRVLWSLNGVVQSVLDNLPLDRFQGVIHELKLLSRLPLIPVKTLKEVELERYYHQERLLLRLRVMPGKHGEDATLQVLRGAALKFHQRQQIATMGRDALTIAQQLQKKLNDLRDRAHGDTQLSGKELESLTSLNQILIHLTAQVQDLQALRSETLNQKSET